MIALVLSLILLILGESLWVARKSSTRAALREMGHLRARALAESGLYKALWYLKGHAGKNEKWRVEDFEEETEEGRYGFTIASIPGGLEIISLSETKGSRPHKAKATGRFRMNWPAALDAALYSQQFLRVSGEKVQAAGRLVSRDRVAVEGFGKEGAFETVSFSRIPLPASDDKLLKARLSDFEKILSEPQRAKKQYNASQAFSRAHIPSVSASGVAYVKGDVSLSGGDIGPFFELSGPGILASSGKIEIEGNVRLKNLKIIASGGIEVSGSSELENCALYSPGEILVKDGAEVSGEIYSRTSIRFTDKSRMASAKSLACVYTSRAGGSLIGKISLEKSSLAQGTLLLHLDPGLSAPKDETGLFIEEDARLKGIAVSQGRLGLLGQVEGAVAAKSFFGNHWGRGGINREMLPEDYALPDILEQKLQKSFKLMFWEVK